MSYKTEKFDQLVHELMDEYKVPGFAFAIIQGDDIWSKVSYTSHCSYHVVTSFRDTVSPNYLVKS